MYINRLTTTTTTTIIFAQIRRDFALSAFAHRHQFAFMIYVCRFHDVFVRQPAARYVRDSFPDFFSRPAVLRVLAAVKHILTVGTRVVARPGLWFSKMLRLGHRFFSCFLSFFLAFSCLSKEPQLAGC